MSLLIAWFHRKALDPHLTISQLLCNQKFSDVVGEASP